jgi:hypothetical protein
MCYVLCGYHHQLPFGIRYPIRHGLLPTRVAVAVGRGGWVGAGGSFLIGEGCVRGVATAGKKPCGPPAGGALERSGQRMPSRAVAAMRFERACV